MGAIAELELKLEAERLCREHTARIESLIEHTIGKAIESSPNSQNNYWLPFIQALEEISRQSTQHADQMSEFKALKKSTELVVMQARKQIPVPVEKSEVIHYPVTLQAPKKQSWWGREVVKPALKLIGFTKKT